MVLGFATIVGEKTGGDGIVGSPLVHFLIAALSLSSHLQWD